jgi:hypothetical protein
MKTKLKLSALLLVAFVAFAPESLACSCASSPPCRGYWEASAVFVGRRVGVRTVTVEVGVGESKYKREMRVFRFAVDRAYRGAKSPFVEVRTGMGGGDCGITFNASEQYLVYAYADDETGTLGTGICTRTAPVAEAAEDLQYIAGLSSPGSKRSGGSVYGAVHKQVREPRGEEEDDEIKTIPVARARVEIEGGGRSSAVETDAEGEYRVEGLAPGDYTVRLKLPETLFIHGPERKVSIAGSVCVGEWFSVEPNGRLVGRVFDSEGRPAAGVSLRLKAAGRKKLRHHGYTTATATAPDGTYEFKGVPPGRYVIQMRFDGEGMYGGTPFPLIYHPNVSDREQAEVVEIGEGARVEGYDLRLPPRPAARTIEGTVTYPDGTPAAELSVNYSSPDAPDTYGSAQTDASGRFSFKGYEALRYKVWASVLSAAGGRWLSSEVLDVPAGGAAAPLKVVVPRP